MVRLSARYAQASRADGQPFDLRTFSNLALTVAILAGGYIGSLVLQVAPECGQKCADCRQLYDFLNKTAFRTVSGPNTPGETSLLWVENNTLELQEKNAVLMWCSNKHRFNLSEFETCSKYIRPLL